MTARAFVRVVNHPTRTDRVLIVGGPAEPILIAADVAGVSIRYDRVRKGWSCPSDRVDDLVAAGEYAHLIYVREPA